MFHPSKPWKSPTKGMSEQPLIDVTKYCKNCSLLNDCLMLGEGNFDLEKLRNTCRCCKTGSQGIYKADAIYSAFKSSHKLQTGNKGKKPTLTRKYGTIVSHLRQNGYTLTEIATNVGISINGVRSVLKELGVK